MAAIDTIYPGAGAKNNWTVNEIQCSANSNGSHWFDPSTMRGFRCKICPEVYQGNGGIFFVSSEVGPDEVRKFTVRQFLPPGKIETAGGFGGHSTKRQAHRMANHLASVDLETQWQNICRCYEEHVTGTGFGKEAPAYTSLEKAKKGSPIKFHTVPISFRLKPFEDGSAFFCQFEGNTPGLYEWQKELCRIAETSITDGGTVNVNIVGLNNVQAKEGGIPVANVVKATHKPLSNLEAFCADLAAHAKCLQRDTKKVRELMRKAATYQKHMEAQCNGDWPYKKDGEQPKVVTQSEKLIEKIAVALGCKGVLFSGDPRGCCVKLTFHDGYTNDFGKEGYCVPFLKDD